MMEIFNNPQFFSYIRVELFAGSLTQGVVDTCNAIFKECNERSVKDLRHIAYILASCYHEAYHKKLNPEWLPVREGFTKTNEGAVKAVTALYNAKKISRNYASPVNGRSYYGRGHIQLTHLDNYKRVGTLMGIDLAGNPDKALQLDISVEIAVRGMVNGWFTGRRLAEFFDKDTTDPFNARKIVNGLDKAKLIEGYYDKFYKALTL